jgi:hypothetical protein
MIPSVLTIDTVGVLMLMVSINFLGFLSAQ